MAYPPEPEVLRARLSFPDAQRALEGVTQSYGAVRVGWHGTTMSVERGSFALAQEDTVYEDLVGDVLRIEVAGRSVFVYVAGMYPDMPSPLMVTRRVWASLSPLTITERLANVARVV
jgi:hypothetical protein